MAVCIQFQPANNFQVAHLGRFIDQFRADYPIPATQPMMVSTLETEVGTENTQEFLLPGGIEIPRAWAISGDHSRLLQFQKNRIVLNWKRAEESTIYPSFSGIHTDFMKIIDSLTLFWQTEFSELIVFNQAELAYVNQVDPPGRDLNQLGSVLPIFSVDLLKSIGSNVDGLAFSYSKPLKSLQGRLHTSINLTKMLQLDGHGAQLEMLARGPIPSSEISSVGKWFDLAHDEITHQFESVTNPIYRKEAWKEATDAS